MTDNRKIWRDAFDDSKLREGRFATMSGVPLEPVYGPDDGEFPGVYPYTRGPYASMYRSRLWTMRMFAGFGTAEDTNWRFKEIIKSGGDGLSTAFDMPTLLGLDSDDPMSLGEVGRCGVAIDSLADMEDLYAGIDLGEITTSMTINSPAAPIFAMFVAQAEKAGVHRSRLGGTLQNDILKEYQAQKEFVFPPRQSMRLVRDTIRSPPRRCRVGTRSRSPATTSAKPAPPPPRSWRSRSPTGSPTSNSRCRPGCRSTRSLPG